MAKSSGCDSPIFIKLDQPKYSEGQLIYSVNVACGKCYNCRHRRVNQWAFRLIQEDRRSVSCYFITLTYDTEHVPLTKRLNMSLDKKHMQDFFKRLRYYNDECSKVSGIHVPKIKYYACGEYGGQFGRPHYHAIIYNVFPDCFEKAWTFGNIQYRAADKAAMYYTLKYLAKETACKTPWDDDVIPEFSLKSKGLGDNYITPESIKHHMQDLNNNYVMSDNFKIALPKYYQRKMWPDGEPNFHGYREPHPWKVRLLGHIKKVVDDTTDKQHKEDIRRGKNPYHMEAIRKNARKNKLKKGGEFRKH